MVLGAETALLRFIDQINFLVYVLSTNLIAVFLTVLQTIVFDWLVSGTVTSIEGSILATVPFVLLIVIREFKCSYFNIEMMPFRQTNH